MLKKLKEQGITILVSTPYMDEANLCDRIALIQKGSILSIDTPRQIIAAYPVKLYAVKAGALHKVLLDIRNYPDTRSCYAFGEHLHVSVPDPEALEKWLEQKGHADIEIKEIEATIEDCFIRLMTTGADEVGQSTNSTNNP
jgi:ABC-2 type transport system ATP-binding protein